MFAFEMIAESERRIGSVAGAPTKIYQFIA